jgi:hypothetical protein
MARETESHAGVGGPGAEEKGSGGAASGRGCMRLRGGREAATEGQAVSESVRGSGEGMIMIMPCGPPCQ